MSNSTRTRYIVGLSAFDGLCLAVSAIGSAATATRVGSGYQTLVTALWQLN